MTCSPNAFARIATSRPIAPRPAIPRVFPWRPSARPYSARSHFPERNDATLKFLTSAGWERDGYVRGLDTGAGPALRELRLHTSLTG